MAVIYLRHPTHGVKIATLDLEAEYDTQNGWERFSPDDPPVQRRERRRADIHPDAMGGKQIGNALRFRRQH